MQFPRCRTHAVARFLVPLAVAWACVASHAAETPLTLGEAQRLALERSRQLGAQALGVTASREMAVAAAQLPDPVVSLGIENLPVEGADKFSLTRDFMTMRRVGVMQQLTRGDKRQLRAERFELEAQKGLAERAVTVAAIQRDAAAAWLDAWFAERIAGVIAEQRLRALQEVAAAESTYRGGKGSQADVFMAQSALALLDDRAAEAERRVRTAQTMLARWTGEADGRALAEKPDLDAIRLSGHALHEELAGHPEIAVMAKQEEIAAAEARLARASKRPDWTVELAYSQRGAAYANMVSLGVSIALPWDAANRQDREVAAKLAVAAQAGAQREEALRMHVAEVLVMLQEWESNRERLVRFEREIIPLAGARAEAALAAYRGGRSRLDEVLAARRNELEVGLQRLQLEAQNARLWAQLNFLFPEEAK
jgi:outer membrane protein TolC